MTINGGVGNDHFIVFHNLDTLSLFGDAGNDTFLVQAFALAGSQEDHRALTDLSGGGGADLIQYAVNAPVNIDGGDGFDTVIVIGTEFNDDFVITDDGVFGAGLHVSFVNIESLDRRRRRGRRPLLRPEHRARRSRPRSTAASAPTSSASRARRR